MEMSAGDVDEGRQSSLDAATKAWDGVGKIHMPPGSKVLYLGAASGTSVSHVSDVVGPEGMVYAVEFSHRSGRDLLNVAKKRTNVAHVSDVVGPEGMVYAVEFSHRSG